MWRCPTQINVLQESKIQRGSDREVLALGEDDMTTVVTLLHILQDVRGVVFAVTASS
jgi:hypothetical protein